MLGFETTDADLGREMTMTTTLAAAGRGTDVLVVHDGIPEGVSAADNELGTRMALDNLAALVESGHADLLVRCTGFWPRFRRKKWRHCRTYCLVVDAETGRMSDDLWRFPWIQALLARVPLAPLPWKPRTCGAPLAGPR